MSTGVLLTQHAVKTCRICLDNDNEKDLISPCMCTGGSAYVHRQCLDNWRSVNKNGRAFKFCDVCHFEFVIEPVVDDPAADKRRLLWFRLLVSRDVIAILLLLQGIIVGMTFLLQAADKNTLELRNLYPASMNSFGVYYLSSFIIFFALLGFFRLDWLLLWNDKRQSRCWQQQLYVLSMLLYRFAVQQLQWRWRLQCRRRWWWWRCRCGLAGYCRDLCDHRRICRDHSGLHDRTKNYQTTHN